MKLSVNNRNCCIEKVDPEKYVVLKKLLGVLHGCAQSKEANTLSMNGAATCVAQCVLSCPQGANDQIRMMTANITIIEFVIEHYPQVFFEGQYRANRKDFIHFCQNGFVPPVILSPFTCTQSYNPV